MNQYLPSWSHIDISFEFPSTISLIKSKKYLFTQAIYLRLNHKINGIKFNFPYFLKLILWIFSLQILFLPLISKFDHQILFQGQTVSHLFEISYNVQKESKFHANYCSQIGAFNDISFSLLNLPPELSSASWISLFVFSYSQHALERFEQATSRNFASHSRWLCSRIRKMSYFDCKLVIT